MLTATVHCLRASGFELAAVKLLLCAQAAGAHHQITPMTRAPVAFTRGDEDAAKSVRKFGDGIISVIYVVMFVAGLTALWAAALTLPIHPLTAVLLALGAMVLLVKVAGHVFWREKSDVSSVEIKQEH